MSSNPKNVGADPTAHTHLKSPFPLRSVCTVTAMDCDEVSVAAGLGSSGQLELWDRRTEERKEERREGRGGRRVERREEGGEIGDGERG